MENWRALKRHVYNVTKSVTQKQFSVSVSVFLSVSPSTDLHRFYVLMCLGHRRQGCKCCLPSPPPPLILKTLWSLRRVLEHERQVS